MVRSNGWGIGNGWGERVVDVGGLQDIGVGEGRRWWIEGFWFGKALLLSGLIEMSFRGGRGVG